MTTRKYDIPEALQDWRSRNSQKGLSWGSLGKKVGRSSSYISRIARGLNAPSFEVEKNILLYVYQDEAREIYDYLEEKYPEKVSIINSLRREIGKKMKVAGSELAPIYNDLPLYHAYRLADAGRFSVQEISKITQTDVEGRIEKFRKNGTLTIEKGIVGRAEQSRNLINSSLKIALKAFFNNLRILETRLLGDELSDSENYDPSQNRLLGIYENLNEQGVKKALDTMGNYVSELREELIKPENQGNIPFFANAFMGRYDFNLDQEKRCR